MTLLDSQVALNGPAFAANRTAMLDLIARVRDLERRTREASAASKRRFENRGQLLPRERLALLLDPGADFLELCTLTG